MSYARSRRSFLKSAACLSIAAAMPAIPRAAIAAQPSGSGQLTPMADTGSPFGRFHFFPKNGNKILIGGVERTIPPGVGVQSGGVICQLNDCIIEKVAHQHAAPNTLYRVYAFMDGATMRLNLSAGTHKEDPTFGNEVHATDPSQSLVGLIRTDENSKINGGAQAQLLLSWFNPCRSPLFASINGFGTFSGSFVAFPQARLEYLLFGINNAFQESFDHPNIIVKANVTNDVPGLTTLVAVAIDGVQNGLLGGMYKIQTADNSHHQDVMALAPGAGGKAEGYHYADFLMLTSPGGRAFVNDGGIFTSPLRL